MTSSVSVVLLRIRFQMSIVKIVELLLKIDVSELSSAANITANMRPRNPEVI